MYILLLARDECQFLRDEMSLVQTLKIKYDYATHTASETQYSQRIHKKYTRIKIIMSNEACVGVCVFK